MAKVKTRYVCQNCGRITPRYLGKCPQCGEFGSMVEQVVDDVQRTRSAQARSGGLMSLPQRLHEVATDGVERLPLPLDEFARVLGGGIVPGSLVLVGGDPGIGKSTLLLQAAAALARSGRPVVYV